MTAGSRTLTRLARPERDPVGQRVEHGLRLGVAGPGGGGDVLAPHRLRVAAGQRHGGVEPAAAGGVAGQPTEPGARREPLPAARACRTGTAGRSGRRPCGRARPANPLAPRSERARR